MSTPPTQTLRATVAALLCLLLLACSSSSKNSDLVIAGGALAVATAVTAIASDDSNNGNSNRNNPNPQTQTCRDGSLIPSTAVCMQTCPDNSRIPETDTCPAPAPIPTKTCADGTVVPQATTCPQFASLPICYINQPIGDPTNPDCREPVDDGDVTTPPEVQAANPTRLCYIGETLHAGCREPYKDQNGAPLTNPDGSLLEPQQSPPAHCNDVNAPPDPDCPPKTTSVPLPPAGAITPTNPNMPLTPNTPTSTPNPMTTQTCMDGSVIPNTAVCMQTCPNGNRIPETDTCPMAPPTQTCRDGTTIPATETCMQTCPNGDRIAETATCPVATKTCPGGQVIPANQRCPASSTRDGLYTDTLSDAEFNRLRTMFASNDEYRTGTARFGQCTRNGAIIPCSTSTHLDLINAAPAYARGATGEGEIITVVDTPLNTAHNEFRGITSDGAPKIHPRSAGFSPFRSSHGTRTSSVAVANRDGVGLHGVAYQSQLHFLGVSLGGGGGSRSYTPLNINTHDPANALRGLVGLGIRFGLGAVANYSFGFNGAIELYNEADIRRVFSEVAGVLAQDGSADTNGDGRIEPCTQDADGNRLSSPDCPFEADRKVIVWAAGNAFNDVDNNGRPATATSPEIYAGLGVHFPELRKNVLAVAAVDQDGEITGFSNRCGIAKDFCLAAPGQGIWTASSESGNYAISNGTSFASPIVAAAFALLRHYFRNSDGSYALGNTEIVTRLLETASKTGRYADSDIYGQGLLDIGAAVTPVGPLTMGLDGRGSNHLAHGTHLHLTGPAFAAPQALSRQLDTIARATTPTAFDQLGAPFPLTPQNLQNWINTPTNPNTKLGYSIQTPTLHQITLATPNAPRLNLAIDPLGNIHNAHLNNNTWTLAYRQHPQQTILTNLWQTATQNFTDPLAFHTPYLAYAQNGTALAWKPHQQKTLTPTLTLSHGKPLFNNQHTQTTQHPNTAATIHYQPNTNTTLQAGTLHEPNAFLGTTTQNAFGKTTSNTTFLGIQHTHQINPNTQILTSAHLGHTKPKLQTTGYLTKTSNITSTAYTLALQHQSLLRKNDWLGIRLTQPLHAENATANLRLPIARTKYRQTIYQNHTLNLTPQNRNLQTEIAYHLPLHTTLGNARLQTTLGIDHNPPHQPNPTSQPYLKLSYTQNF